MEAGLIEGTEWADKAYAGTWKTVAGGSLEVREPATSQPIGRVGKAGTADVRASCAAARAAQKSWASMPYPERAKVFRKAAELLEANRPGYATWIVRET